MKTIITLIVLVSISLGAQAQERESEIYPEQVSIDHNSAVQQFSRQFVSTLGMSGANLHAETSDLNNIISVGISGSDNITDLNQSGLQNLISLTIFGNRNETFMSQDGDNNTAVVLFDGDDNSLGLTQEGSFNRYFNFRQGNGHQDQVLQSGNHLMLEISGDGLPVSIEQYGNGAGAVVTTQRGYN